MAELNRKPFRKGGEREKTKKYGRTHETRSGWKGRDYTRGITKKETCHQGNFVSPRTKSRQCCGKTTLDQPQAT